MSGFIPIQPEYVLVHTGYEDCLLSEKDKHISTLQKYNEENDTSFELVGMWADNIFLPFSNTAEEFEWLEDAPSLSIFKASEKYMDLIYGLFLNENFYCQSIGIISICYNSDMKALLVELDSA
jgi:hypothetical protein